MTTRERTDYRSLLAERDEEQEEQAEHSGSYQAEHQESDTSDAAQAQGRRNDPREEHPITYEFVMDNVDEQARFDEAKTAMAQNWAVVELALEKMENEPEAVGMQEAMTDMRILRLEQMEGILNDDNAIDNARQEAYDAISEQSLQDAAAFLRAMTDRSQVMICHPWAQEKLDTADLSDQGKDTEAIIGDTEAFLRSKDELTTVLLDNGISSDTMAWKTMERASDRLETALDNLREMNENEQTRGALAYEINKARERIDLLIRELQFLLRPAPEPSTESKSEAEQSATPVGPAGKSDP